MWFVYLICVVTAKRSAKFWRLARIEPLQDNIARSAYFSISSGNISLPFLVVWNAHTWWSAVQSCRHSVSLPATTFLAFHPSELSSSPLIVPKPHAAHTSPPLRTSTSQDTSTLAAMPSDSSLFVLHSSLKQNSSQRFASFQSLHQRNGDKDASADKPHWMPSLV